MGSTSMTDFPSSLVFNSMLPLSPSRWKITEAFSMGLESVSRTTVTSMREVGGGGLYLRPRCAESCAERLRPETAMSTAATTVTVRKRELNDMEELYLFACASSEAHACVGIRRLSNSWGGKP